MNATLQGSRNGQAVRVDMGQEALGDDRDWVVDVVLRALGEADVQDQVTARVAETLDSQGKSPPKMTYSFDMEPPDGSLGVSCWVRADSASAAIATVLPVVPAATTAPTGPQHPQRDLRL